MTEAGREALALDPDNQGSLGLAISEAVEEAASRADTTYGLGSVLNHVLLHQTIIGLEAKKQFEKIGLYPDVILGPAVAVRRSAASPFPSSPTRRPATSARRTCAASPSSRPRARR